MNIPPPDGFERVLVYVAGPIHGSGTVEENVRAAVEAGEKLRAHTFLTCIPHLNVLWSLIHTHPADWWLENDLEILSRCSVLLRLPGESPGSDREVEFAREHDIPVFYGVDELIAGCGSYVEKPHQG